MKDTDAPAQIRTLRHEHPDAEVVTDLVRIDDGFAVVRAAITVPTGGKATGHGSASRDDHDDYVEQAETVALVRALAALGYGSEIAPSDQIEIVDEPRDVRVRVTSEERVEQQPAPIVIDDVPDMARPVVRGVSQAEEPVVPVTPTPMPSRSAPDRRSPGQSHRSAAPVEIGSARERTSSTSPTPFPSQTSNASAPTRSAPPSIEHAEQPPLEDYSWTAFWKWAREQGYESKGGIEAFIGRQMNNLSPAEVRQLIVAKRGGA